MGTLDKSALQSVSLNISANDEKMVIVLNREARVTLLVNMPHSTGGIVSMIPHRVSAADPSHEAAHFAIDLRTSLLGGYL